MPYLDYIIIMQNSIFLQLIPHLCKMGSNEKETRRLKYLALDPHLGNPVVHFD